jgi:DNA-binding response OmpR family regulator
MQISFPELGGPPCILVIDDEEMILSFLQLALQEYGYQVVTFRSTEKALLQLNQTISPQAALVDMGLGRKEFLDLQSQFPHLPCILMGSDFAEVERNELLQLGAQEVLEKPFALAEVLSLLEKVVKV